MSYCRFSDGDVYMFDHIDGYIECCACRLTPLGPTIFTKAGSSPSFGEWDDCQHCGGEGCEHCGMHGFAHFDTPQEALVHLLEHREAGHSVPSYAIEALQREIEEVDDGAD